MRNNFKVLKAIHLEICLIIGRKKKNTKFSEV